MWSPSFFFFFFFFFWGGGGRTYDFTEEFSLYYNIALCSGCVTKMQALYDLLLTVVHCFRCRCSLPSLQRRKVAIARLKHPANLGRTSQEIRFFILVLAPMREKGTKNALETARTFATLLADIECRQKLLEVRSGKCPAYDFKGIILQCSI